MNDATVVILAGGKSTRTYPLTLTKPKALLKALDRTILEHNLEQLEGLVEDVIIVVGYFGDKIKEKIGSKFGSLKIQYVKQAQQNGTGSALLACKDLLKDRFLVLNGDDFYSQKDIEKCLTRKYCVLAKRVENPGRFGIFLKEGSKIIGFEEKPENPKSSLANAGLYMFDRKIFDFNLEKSKRGEYEITDYVKFLINRGSLELEEVQGYWIPIVYSWDLLDANLFFLNKLEKFHIGKNSILKPGAVIEEKVFIGDNCVIGPNCYIRNGTAIGNNCRIGNSVEIKNSIIGDNVNVSHLSYIGDSILGDKINIGGGTVLANFRFDEKEVQVKMNGKKVGTGKTKFGSVLGDEVKTGVNSSIMPGLLIDPKSVVEPGSVLKKNI